MNRILYIVCLSFFSFSALSGTTTDLISHISEDTAYCSNVDGSSIISSRHIDVIYDNRTYTSIGCRTTTSGLFKIDISFEYPTIINSINFRTSLDHEFTFAIKNNISSDISTSIAYSSGDQINSFNEVSSLTLYGYGAPLTEFLFQDISFNGIMTIPDVDSKLNGVSLMFFKLPSNVINKNL